MDQKNFILAMGLIIGFLLLWSTFVIPRFAPPPGQVPAGGARETTSAAPAGAVTPPGGACGKPWSDFSVPFGRSFADSGPESS